EQGKAEDERTKARASEQVASRNAVAATENAKLAAAERDRVRSLFNASNMNLAQVAHTEQRVGRLREPLDDLRPGPREADLRGFEWHYLHRLVSSQPVFRLPRPSIGMVLGNQQHDFGSAGTEWQNSPAPFSPDGRWAFSFRHLDKPAEKKGVDPRWDLWTDCELEVYDTRTGQLAFRHGGNVREGFGDVVLTSRGLVAFGAYQTVTFFDIATGNPVHTLEVARPMIALRCDAAGTRLLVAHETA